PERKRQTTWKTFLKAHWKVLAAVDFTTVEVWSTKGLVTFYLLCVMELATRRVHFAGVTASPDSPFLERPRGGQDSVLSHCVLGRELQPKPSLKRRFSSLQMVGSFSCPYEENTNDDGKKRYVHIGGCPRVFRGFDRHDPPGATLRPGPVSRRFRMIVVLHRR